VDMSSHSSLCNRVKHILDSFSLTQVVDEPTGFGYDGTASLIDLVLMSN